MTMENLKKSDSEIHEVLSKELKRQKETIELIASENIVSQAVMEAQGSCLTNKYAEGYPGKRYYGGCEFADVAESLGHRKGEKNFLTRALPMSSLIRARRQILPYFLALAKPGETLMGLNLSHGGHLTHGNPFNVSGKWFNIVAYNVDKNTELIDYDEMERLAVEHKPKIIISAAQALIRESGTGRE